MLIIGGTGTIGRQLVKSAISKGYRVRCLVRGYSSSRVLRLMGAQLIYGDLSKPSTLLKSFRGIKIVIDASTTREGSGLLSEFIDWRAKLALLEISKIINIKKYITFTLFNTAINSKVNIISIKGN